MKLPDVIEWDVVEYLVPCTAGPQSPGPSQRRRLGKVTKIQEDGVEVEPLVEEEEGVWVADETCPAPQLVPSSCLVTVVAAELGQRQDRGPSNPHGEHAHDIWQVSQPLHLEIYRGEAVERVLGKE